MKKIYFIALFFFSKIVFSSEQNDPTQLVQNLNIFLRQFDVVPTYQQSQQDFLQAIRDSHKFEYACYKSDKNHNSIIALLTPDALAIKRCGFWGNVPEGFHVGSPVTIISHRAKFHTKGSYEWTIQLPDQLSDNEFSGTPIKPLVDYLVAQSEPNIEIPLSPGLAVSFVKEAQKITACLQYK